MKHRKFEVNPAYRPYIDRFKNHPFVLPVTLFLLLFFLGLASLIVLGGSTLEPSDTHLIELSIEGTRQSLPTRAATVGEFLERADIKLGEFDIVEPSADTPIDDDKFHINVYRARPVTIIDGGNRIFAYSAAATPRSVAQQAGLTVYPEDNLNSSMPGGEFLREGVLGEKVVIDRATPAFLNLYGAPLSIRTQARTVADLLKEKNIKLGPNDSVQPALETPITPQIQVFVLITGTQVVTVEEPIPMPVDIIEDASLSFGVSVVRQQGSPGKRVVTYQIDLVNGQETGRHKLQEVLAAPPVKQIVARGPAGSFGQALAKLRQCEAGGNYATNTGNGYYGAYQYNISTWNGYFGYRIPSDAPPVIQDQKATETYQRRGWQPWPACSRKLGLQDIYR
jgi:uncharacterized protein YabE (DUF348 family)